MQAIPEVIEAICSENVPIVGQALHVIGQAIKDMKEALKLMHGRVDHLKNDN